MIMITSVTEVIHSIVKLRRRSMAESMLREAMQNLEDRGVQLRVSSDCGQFRKDSSWDVTCPMPKGSGMGKKDSNAIQSAFTTSILALPSFGGKTTAREISERAGAILYKEAAGKPYVYNVVGGKIAKAGLPRSPYVVLCLKFVPGFEKLSFIVRRERVGADDDATDQQALQGGQGKRRRIDRVDWAKMLPLVTNLRDHVFTAKDSLVVMDTGAVYRHSLVESAELLLSNQVGQQLEDLACPHLDQFSDIASDVRGKVIQQLSQIEDKLGGTPSSARITRPLPLGRCWWMSEVSASGRELSTRNGCSTATPGLR